MQGLKLHWCTLEGLVAAEAGRPGSSPGAAAGLLGAAAFHRCVAACAFEVVAAAYRMVSALVWLRVALAFPMHRRV